jgi:anti-anti-sigma regulatory factor
LHFVAISKLPEFTEDGEVVPGQCEPYTSSWRLRLVVDGETETLISGTYYELRRIQRRCIGKSPDDIRAMAAEAAASVGKSAMQPQQTGEGDQATQILGVEDVRRAMLQMEAAVNAEGGPTQLDWVELSMEDGKTLASVKSAGEMVDTDELGRVLQAALARTEKGMVVDLSGVEASSHALARCLRDLGHRAHLENRQLQIVCPHEPLQQAAYEASAGSLNFAPDVETALKAVSPVENLP